MHWAVRSSSDRTRVPPGRSRDGNLFSTVYHVGMWILYALARLLPCRSQIPCVSSALQDPFQNNLVFQVGSVSMAINYCGPSSAGNSNRTARITLRSSAALPVFRSPLAQSYPPCRLSSASARFYSCRFSVCFSLKTSREILAARDLRHLPHTLGRLNVGRSAHGCSALLPCANQAVLRVTIGHRCTRPCCPAHSSPELWRPGHGWSWCEAASGYDPRIPGRRAGMPSSCSIRSMR
jgi:hypothetical protein